jgi:hypothetical protein
LIEHFVVDGVACVAGIAGFYRVQSGRITAKIYREAHRRTRCHRRRYNVVRDPTLSPA